MLEQVLNIEGAEKGAPVTITMRIMDGKVVSLTAKNGEGVQYVVTLQLTPVGAQTLDGPNLCCCPDPELGIICREINGPCPPCE